MSELTFHYGGPGREIARLGHVQIGQVVELQAGNGRVRAWWQTDLPDDDVRAPVGSATVRGAKFALIGHVCDWARRLGVPSVALIRDQALLSLNGRD